MNPVANAHTTAIASPEVRKRNRRWGLVLLLIVLLGAIAAPVVFQDHWWHSIGKVAQQTK